MRHMIFTLKKLGSSHDFRDQQDLDNLNERTREVTATKNDSTAIFFLVDLRNFWQNIHPWGQHPEQNRKGKEIER